MTIKRGNMSKLILIFFLVIGAFVVLFVFRNYASSPSMTVDLFEPCDVNRDGDCDAADFELLTKAIGQCDDGDNYNELADADHDGCVTEKDKRLLFPTVERVPAGSPPMIADPYEPCDIDGDSDCDAADFQRVSGAIGQCIGDSNYIRLADADHDGCVTENDREKLFPSSRK